jgi:hypothetical protein
VSGDGQSEKLGQPLTGAATQSVGLTTSERQQLTTTKSEPDEHPDDRALRVHKDYALFWLRSSSSLARWAAPFTAWRPCSLSMTSGGCSP